MIVDEVILHNPILKSIGKESALDVSFVDEVCFQDRWSWGELEYRADMSEESRRYFAAECCGLLVGFGGGKFIEDDLFRINVIAVEPGHRGLGLGEDLLKLLMDSAEDGGAEGITCEVAESEVRICRAVMANGFEIDGFLEDYYSKGVGAHQFRTDLL